MPVSHIRALRAGLSPQADFRDLPVAGIQPMTTIDFPDRLAAVIFTRGCPWNCSYCHNSTLRAGGESLSWEKVEAFFRDRAGFLDGVVVSGGEPMLHSGLPGLLIWLRRMGYATAVHTNGYYPAMLLTILKQNLADFVAMDIKAPPAIYDRVTRAENSCIEVARSIRIILDSGVDCEFRTTWHPAVLSEYELLDTVRAASLVGVKKYFIQRFRRIGVGDSDLAQSPDCEFIPPEVVKEAKRLFPVFEVR
ncbi:MAG: anaerobic ribonucleoside-triphosphate reductase activating protein [Candidatus Latescibacterota bacterium]